MKTRMVVTGATGFVGRFLVDELLNQGKEVIIIVRDIKKIPTTWKNKVICIQSTLDHLADLEMDMSADIFFHFAWEGTAGMDRADYRLQLKNVKSACDAVMLAKRMGCGRFVYAGSIMEYEARQYVSQDGAMPGMSNIYSIAKMTGDFMAKTVAVREGLDYINVLISNIYGVGEYSTRFLNTTLRKMLNQESIPLTHGRQTYDFIYASDAAKMIVFAAINGDKNSEYYIGNREQKPLRDFLVIMKQIVNSSSELCFGEIPMTTANLTYHEFETDKLYRMGFKTDTTFEEGIKRTVQWMQQNK